MVNDVVYRFCNTQNEINVCPLNRSERDQVIRTIPWFIHEGVIRYAGAAPASQSSPMYRFLNRSNAAHLHTINANERDIVMASAPNFVYEGIAYEGCLSP